MTTSLTHLPYGDISAQNITLKNIITPTQYIDDPQSGDTVEINCSFLILHPANCLSELTLVFPPKHDGFKLTIVSHRPVTTLTIENADFENNAPNSLDSHVPSSFVYSMASDSWWNA